MRKAWSPADGLWQRWFDATYAPVRSMNGHVVAVVVTMRDITAEREAHESLRQALERSEELGRIFEISVDMVCVCDVMGA